MSMSIKNQGLYLKEFEHENCGAGFICNLNGDKTNQIIHKKQLLLNIKKIRSNYKIQI